MASGGISVHQASAQSNHRADLRYGTPLLRRLAVLPANHRLGAIQRNDVGLGAGGTQPVAVINEPFHLPQEFGRLVRRRKQEQLSLRRTVDFLLAIRVSAGNYHQDSILR